MTHWNASAATSATTMNATIRRLCTGYPLSGYTRPNRYPNPRTVWM
jgi:hypothetical protein